MIVEAVREYIRESLNYSAAWQIRALPSYRRLAELWLESPDAVERACEQFPECRYILSDLRRGAAS
jgi:hypothetical protein